MTPKRILAGLLSMVFLTLLGLTFFPDASTGDPEDLLFFQATLGVAAVLGIVYAAYGRLPDWIIDLSDGSLTHDDDPSNISPRVYLPILFALVLVVVLAFIMFVP